MKGAFRLGEVRVDPDTLTLHTEDGARQVEARVMDVLLCLVREAPRTVSPEFMLDAVWSDVIVGDNSVHRAIATLRKSLGDSARAPTYIQTVPKRGYRLLAEVVEEAAPPDAPASAVAEPSGPAALAASDFAPGDCLVACAHPELGLAQQLAAELSLAGVRAVAMPAEDIVLGDSV
ncbi:MAG: winged helix-turn-helix domain-containing protein, partial [Pseudomonadales bacterium]|nr:winged helix-turn-helix domain-containing protein [Pseudomonadales bacterium]